MIILYFVTWAPPIDRTNDTIRKTFETQSNMCAHSEKKHIFWDDSLKILFTQRFPDKRTQILETVDNIFVYPSHEYTRKLYFKNTWSFSNRTIVYSGSSILVICKTGQTTTWDFSHCRGNYDYHSMCVAFVRLIVLLTVTFLTNLYRIHVYININIELWAMTMHVFKL